MLPTRLVKSPADISNILTQISADTGLKRVDLTIMGSGHAQVFAKVRESADTTRFVHSVVRDHKQILKQLTGKLLYLHFAETHYIS